MATNDGIRKLKADFKDRLFFYPADAMYILTLARTLHLKKNQEYRLYSLMGSAELCNTLPLYTNHDFNPDACRINLHLALPTTEEKIKKMLDALVVYANKNPADNLPPLTVAFLNPKLDAFLPLLKMLTKNPLKYQNLRIVLGMALPTLYKTEELKTLYATLIYGFNPLDEEWERYLNHCRRKPYTLLDHANQLFARRFGFFSLSATPEVHMEDADFANFIRYLVLQGVRGLETHFNQTLYFNRPQIVQPLIEEFGLLETGGMEDFLPSATDKRSVL